MDAYAGRLSLQRMVPRRQLEANILADSCLSNDGLARTEANEIVSTTIIYACPALVHLETFFRKSEIKFVQDR